jgi:acyl dehydratase
VTEHPIMSRFPPQEGEGPPPLHQRISQARIDAYAEASGDHNPIHLNEQFARSVGLPSTIAHGLLTLGVACAAVEQWCEAHAWTGRVACRFSAPLPSGQTVSGHPKVVRSDEEMVVVELEALSETGERVLSKAEIELRPLG